MLPTVPANPRLLRKLPPEARDWAKVDPTLKQAMRDLVAGNLRWPLLIFGPSGTGKTSASLALADRIETASYTTAEDLATFVMTHDAIEVESEWKRIAGKSLAILDELACRERVTDLGYSVVKKFMDLREQEAGRVAIFVTNVEPGELVGLYDRKIYSRATAGTVIELTGADRRKVGA